MPTTARPENHIIRLFVSAYEKGSWKDAALTCPDEVKDGGIDGFAERTDGATLAIEHTVVEPFVGDIEDQTEMLPMFPSIEKDVTLLVPGAWIRLFVPVGTLHLQKPGAVQIVLKIRSNVSGEKIKTKCRVGLRIMICFGAGRRPES